MANAHKAHGRTNFIPRNEGFICAVCETRIPPAKGTFRNHCPHCLTSKHVDNTPGDRANLCQGLMPTVRIEGTDPSKLDLVQQCTVCGHEARNKIASDDNRDTMFELMKQR